MKIEQERYRHKGRSIMETMLAILILAVVRLAVPFAVLMIIGTVVQRRLKATDSRA